MNKYKLKEILIEKYGCICKYCESSIEKDKIQIEHIVPYKQGGKTDESNCVLSCNSCNSSKYNLSLHQWLRLTVNKKDKALCEYNYRMRIIKNIEKMIEGKQ